MNNATDTDIQAVIDSFTSNQTSFTAYDITKQIRHNNLHVMHDEVKYYLKNNMPVNYKKTMHPLVKAFIFHDLNSDPNNYNKDNIPDYVIVRSHTPITQHNSNGSVDVVVQDNRFRVLSNEIKSAGFKAGDVLNLDSTNGKITLSKNGSGNAVYVVDVKNNCRFHINHFITAFGYVPKSINHTVKSGKITIEE